jgi:hemerythrin-like domain-containing protein
MRRSASLAALSRDHQHGLAVARRLIRATADTAPDARARFLAFWRSEGARHFRIEEEVLLPAFAGRVPADHEAIVRVLVEHVDVQRRAAELESEPSLPPEALHELGEVLHGHIRYEERELFPLIEQELPDAELKGLAVTMERAEREG